MSITISDAGTHFIISAPTREAVEGALDELRANGAKVLSPPAQVGARWMATCENKRVAVPVQVEKFGMKSIVTAATREAVEAKVAELLELGSRLDQAVEQIDGVWTAVLDDAS